MKPCSLRCLRRLAVPLLLWGDIAAAGVDAHLPLLEQLMRQEMESFASASLDLREPSAASVAKPEHKPELLAVYGVGGRLSIEVKYDGHVYRYPAGRRDPVGWDAGKGPLRLRGMSGRCASLEHDEGSAEACLPDMLARHAVNGPAHDGAGHAGR